MVDNSSNSIGKTLRGRTIGFFTSVDGMGGSEVAIADAMEAAFGAGARIVCWSVPKAPIRKITQARNGRLEVDHRDWPLESKQDTPDKICTKPRKQSIGRATWRRLAPMSLKRWAGFSRNSVAFAQELRRLTPDLLFVNVNGSEAESLAGPRCGIPVINCFHLSFTPSTGSLLARIGDWRARRATIKAAALTVHVSNTVRDQWSSRFGYPLERTRVIYNGVEPIDLADRQAARSRLGIGESEFVFCVPGRLDAMKGHQYLIQALRGKNGLFANTRVLICGDGGLRAELEASVAQAELGQIVSFLGWRTDLPVCFQASDCTILPSTSSENMSIAIMESLMAGTPAIVTRVGGMAEAVRDGETGFVVPPRDSEALSAAMLRMMRDRSEAAKMRQAARADALSRFTRERMMADYVEVFAEALQRFSPRASQ